MEVLCSLVDGKNRSRKTSYRNSAERDTVSFTMTGDWEKCRCEVYILHMCSTSCIGHYGLNLLFQCKTLLLSALCWRTIFKFWHPFFHSINNAGMNILIHVTSWNFWRISLGEITKSEIAGLVCAASKFDKILSN